MAEDGARHERHDERHGGRGPEDVDLVGRESVLGRAERVTHPCREDAAGPDEEHLAHERRPASRLVIAAAPVSARSHVVCADPMVVLHDLAAEEPRIGMRLERVDRVPVEVRQQDDVVGQDREGLRVDHLDA